MRIVCLVAAVVVVVHGFVGPQLAPRNLATLVPWVHYRGALVIGLLLVGNLACMVCPFSFSRDLLRRILVPARVWPKALRNKWLSLGLFAAVLFAYEWLDLWAAPSWTAMLILAYWAACLSVDSIFENASFCKWVCPVGQFNFIASTLSPAEVRVSDPRVCEACSSHDCLAGRRRRSEAAVLQRPGCQLGLHQPGKRGNLDCTFCLDCAAACPHGNVGIGLRLPGAELWESRHRAGVGRVSERWDITALAVLFGFGALLNAFGMVRPGYELLEWLAATTGLSSEAAALLLLFLLGLLLLPGVLLLVAAWLTRVLARVPESSGVIVRRFSLVLVPLGFGMWLSHYCFHFLTGALTVVPVVQDLASFAGAQWLGAPRWTLSGLPVVVVKPLELCFLGLGALGSLLASVRIAQAMIPRRPWRAAAPWFVLTGGLLVFDVWVMWQPMEMRGTFFGG